MPSGPIVEVDSTAVETMTWLETPVKDSLPGITIILCLFFFIYILAIVRVRTGRMVVIDGWRDLVLLFTLWILKGTRQI